MTDNKITSLADLRKKGTKKTLGPDMEAECWLALLSAFDENGTNLRTAIHKLKDLYPQLRDGLKQRCAIMMLFHTDQTAIAKWCADELLVFEAEAETGEAKLLIYDSLIVAADNELLDITMLGKVGDRLHDLFLSDQRGDVISMFEEEFLTDVAFDFFVDQLISSAELIEDDEYVAAALATALDNDEIDDDLRDKIKTSLFSFLNGEGFDVNDAPTFNELANEGAGPPDEIKTLNWESLASDNTVAFPGTKSED